MIGTRPPELFDRADEWADLVHFANDQAPGMRLGIVYGRRRMGKSYLLESLVGRSGGLYHQALEEERTPALARLGAAIAAERGLPGASVALVDWPAALAALAGGATVTGPRLVVLDEFPYLLGRAPELASAVQAVHDAGRRDPDPRLRLVLCGSAMSVMSRLLSGQQALRGRAVLELIVRPFGYREAAAFWGVTENPRLALLLHAVVGGTPGYRDLLGGRPRALGGSFERWLADGVLNPSHALFREADHLLAEDPSLSDRAIYQSALAAIAAGRRSAGAVAAALGRRETSMTHVLDGLERAGFVERSADPLRARRPSLRIVDPLVRFSHVVVRPDLRRFEARRTVDAWRDAGDRFRAGVLGPSFEEMAREWVSQHASPETLGGGLGQVGSTVLADPAGRSQLEIDVLALARREVAGAPARVLLIGEAKAGPEPRGLADLRRLDRARDLLARKVDAADARLAIVAAGGFDRNLRSTAAKRPDVELVDLERLYGGS